MKTDQQLQQDVLAELQWEPSVQAEHIGVLVKDGVVTLEGEVHSYVEKWNAVHAAQRVSGVQALATELTVQLQSLNERSDADIASTVSNLLAWNGAMPGSSLEVAVEGGWVTLTGHVQWHYQRQAVTDSVRRMMGVRGVHNQLRLQPSTPTGTVKADIRAALDRAASIDAGQVEVTVQGSDVTLSGTVPNWTGRESVLNAAWSVPGVRTVVDHLKQAH